MKLREVYSPNRSALGAKITTTPPFGKGGVKGIGVKKGLDGVTDTRERYQQSSSGVTT